MIDLIEKKEKPHFEKERYYYIEKKVINDQTNVAKFIKKKEKRLLK